MASSQLVDFPENNIFNSVYSPIKYTLRVNGGISDGQTQTVDDFVSVKVTFVPYNDTLDLFENGGTGNLPNRQFSVRVPYTPFVHGWSHTSTPNDGTYRYFSIDVAPLMRNYLSYNLRPCSHDVTNNKIKRDITLSQVATNLFYRYEVSLAPEYITNTGSLKSANNNAPEDLRKFTYPRVINSALSYEEEINGYLSEQIEDEGSGYPSLFQHTVINDLYTHDSNIIGKKYGKMKYLSVKPTHRVIGIDESEYITFAAKNGANGIYGVITFYDSNGSVIDNNNSGGYYGINLNATANGDGTNHANGAIFSYGRDEDNTGNTNPMFGVFQIGVGTRNIKELGITAPSKFRNSQPLTDFSNVSYYTFKTHRNASPYEQIGETITYHIDHNRKSYGDTVRFHWQSRLGGIDSYTFDGSSIRGIEARSSTFQQSIYPKFNGQLSGTATGTNLFIGDHDFQTTASENGGAFIQRISGVTDDQYPSIRKHHVDAYGNGTAISRPISQTEREMMEDLISSPNVWTERGWGAKEIFREDFSSYTSLSDVSNNWTLTSGALDSTSDAFVTDEGHITGNKALKVGDNSGNDYVRMETKATFDYDPNKLYEFEIRIKGVTYQNDNAPLYFGMNGLAANGTTLINTSGADSTSQQHYFGAAAEQLDGNDKYVVLRGYISGHIRSSGTYGGERRDPMNHARAYTGVKKFEPIILLNYGGDTYDGIGTTILDYIKVTEYTPEQKTQAKLWSSLNRHYYVPVVIKDSSQELFNSEEVSTVSVNYVESRKKRGIRN